MLEIGHMRENSNSLVTELETHKNIGHSEEPLYLSFGPGMRGLLWSCSYLTSDKDAPMLSPSRSSPALDSTDFSSLNAVSKTPLLSVWKVF